MNQQIFVLVYCTLLGESHAQWGPIILYFVAFKFVCKNLIVISQDIIKSFWRLMSVACHQNYSWSVVAKMGYLLGWVQQILFSTTMVKLSWHVSQKLYSNFVISKKFDCYFTRYFQIVLKINARGVSSKLVLISCRENRPPSTV